MLKISTKFRGTLVKIPTELKRRFCFISEQKINIGDISINYVKSGDGYESILLMPGVLGSAWTDYKPQIKQLPKLLRNHTIYAWDPPGYGKSIPPCRTFCLDFFRRDAEIAHTFMSALKINKYSILGWSDGGITGMISAAYYADSVDKLVIWGANAYITPGELENLERMRDLSLWSQKIRQPLENLYGKDYFERTWNEWLNCMARFLTEQNGDICKNDLKDIVCQTLILHGDKDPMIDEQHVPYLMENIRNSKLKGFVNGKHNIHLRYSDEFNETVASFFS